MAIKELLKNNKYYIIDGLVFLLVLAAFIGVLLFMNKSISQYTGIKNEINSTKLTYQLNSQTISNYQKSNVGKTNFLDSLPTQDTLVNWISQLEQMASNTGTSETLTFTGGELAKGDIVLPGNSINSQSPTIGADLVIRGTYNTVLDYIYLLEHGYYYTKIDGITFSYISKSSTSSGPALTPTPASSPNQTVTATLTIEVFVKDATSQVPN